MVTFFFTTKCQTKPKESRKQETKLEFESFKEIPAEIDGCSCCFSKNDKEYSEEQFIYVNNYTNYAYIKIHGELKKFMEIEHSKHEHKKSYYIYQYNDFTLRVDITESVPDGYESSKLHGRLTLTDKDGQKTIQEFVGNCGC